MIATGFIVFLSLIVMIWRLPKKQVKWLLGHPLYLELPFGVAAYVLHWGTFSGMMAAAVAAICVFFFTQVARILVGYHDGKYDVSGIWSK